MLKDSTVKDLDTLLRQARSARGRMEPIWFLNLAFFEGNQWLAWDGRGLFRPQMPKNRLTLTDNRIQPCVRTEIARMTKSRPVFTVTPQSSDEEDTNAAKLGDKLMRFLWKDLHMQELSMKALEWSRICGAGFLKCYWDSTVGDKVDLLVGPDGGVLTGEDGRPVKPGTLPPLPGVTQKTVAQGDIRVEARSPFQMFVDPIADSFPEAEWLIEESVKSVEYVKRRYGVEMPADTPANPGLVQSRIAAGVGGGDGAYKGVKVKEYWSKPSSQHPTGRRAVWCNDKLLLEDNRPFDPMPYIMFSGIPVPGRLWPSSIVEQLRGPQTELNKVKSQIAENRNRVGNPTIVASKQATQDPEKATEAISQPGTIWWIDDIGSPNAIPQHLQAPPLPAYVIDEIARIEESIQEISGQHEVTSAQVPPGVTAASAINLLQEADDTRLGPGMADYEFQLGLFGQKLLRLAARYYTDARSIRIGGDNGAWEIFDFRGSMLRDNTHVEVQAGSAFPQSKAAKQAQIQDLMTFLVQSGNAPTGQKLAQFLQDTQLGAAERLVEQYTENETQCNRENVLLSQGQALPVNEYDDDEAHIGFHTSFQKASRYSQLPAVIQRIFEMHVQMHRDRVAQQQQAQMQMAMQMQGTPSPEQQAQQGQQQAAQSQQQQAQGQQQLFGQAQDQGYSAAQAEQSQRQAEELHSQKLRHNEEQHAAQMRRLAQQQQQQGAQSGRRAA